ncbi:von Willebrand factor type A domain-containing protein [Leptodontidium sp. 2 PMI_412]|nr:von Willebrand factor type A domain-containing protein [Leptodontidium sp. 2 PMI_412]
MSTTARPHPRQLSTRTKLCGCFSVGTVRQQYLPLLDCEAHMTILSGTSKTVLKQTFVNALSSKSNAECMYKFPLYDGVSVVGFKCKIGTKPALCGLVKERGKAKAIFDATMAEGDNVGLLAQAPEASDMFTTRIGNVQVGEGIFVEIAYIGELKHDDDIEGIRFTITTMIAPRYGHTESISPPCVAGLAGAMIPPLGHHPDNRIRITINIVLPAGIYIKGIESLSHLIAVSMGAISIAAQATPVMNKASATLSQGAAVLEKDFVLFIHLKDPGTPKALLETHPTVSNHRALMIMLAASKFSFSSSLPSEIILIADRSASMRHNIPMLVSALKVFLKSMPTSVRFNICSFGTEHTFLWTRSKSYTNSALQEAIPHLSTFEANYGGTEILKAIQATIERRLTDLPLDIILFTDGQIADQGSPFTYVNEQVEKTKQGGIRVFSLGFGNKVSHAVIEGIARAGKGICLAVQDGKRLEKSVTRILPGALSPHYGDMTESMEKLSSSETEEVTTSLSDPGSDPKDKSLRDTHHSPQIIQAPHKIPSLFAAAKTTVYLLMDPKTVQRNPTSVILRSPFSRGPPALEIPIEVLTERGTTIHQLAARKAAQDLEESRGRVFDDANKIADVQNLAEKEAVRLEETFQVVNKWYILGFEIPKPPLDGASDEAWVTMLVVKFLEERMPKEKDVWDLVVKKAREYVRKCLETRGELHLLEEMAGAVVGTGKLED